MKCRIYLLFPLAFIIASCSKTEGTGGNSSIRGKVMVRSYDKTFTKLQGVYPGTEINVYINYGSQPGVGNSMKTDYNGDYYFPYLFAGNYTVYAYSKDSTLKTPNGQLVAKQDFFLGSNQNNTLPDLVIAQ